jgi:hypothetical protein
VWSFLTERFPSFRFENFTVATTFKLLTAKGAKECREGREENRIAGIFAFL